MAIGGFIMCLLLLRSVMLLPSCAQPFQVAGQCTAVTGQPSGRIMCLIDHLRGTGEDRYTGCRFLQFYSQCRNMQAQSLGLIASLLVAFVCLPEYAKCGLELRVPAFYFADFPDLAQPVLHVLQILALLLKVFDLAIESFQFILKKLPRSEEHTSELQSHLNLVCRLLLE